MAEKGVTIKNQAGGKSIAARDAFEVDSDGNPRIVQMVDQAQRHVALDRVAPLRDITVSDSIDLSAVLAGSLLTGILEVGDANSIVVQVQIEDPGGGALNPADGVIITPLIVDNSGIVNGILMPRFFTGYSPATGMNPLNYTDAGALVWTFCPAASWDIKGSARIALHAQLLPSITHACIYGAPASGLAELAMPSSMALASGAESWTPGAAAAA